MKKKKRTPCFRLFVAKDIWIMVEIVHIYYLITGQFEYITKKDPSEEDVAACEGGLLL